jgi:hypothetical protein
MVGVVLRAAGDRFNGRECYRTGKGIDGAINKQNGLGAGNVFS